MKRTRRLRNDRFLFSSSTVRRHSVHIHSCSCSSQTNHSLTMLQLLELKFSKVITPHSAITPVHTHTCSTTRVSWYQKGKTNLHFTEARDSEWQWHRLGHMPVCTSLQTDNHASTPPLSFLQAECPSCCPTNSIKALKAFHHFTNTSVLNNTAFYRSVSVKLTRLNIKYNVSVNRATWKQVSV